MQKLIKVEEVVEQILRQDKYSRNNDIYLILKYITKVYPYEVGKRFEEAMTNVSKKGLSFESITRARRKIQSKHKELRATREVQEARAEEQDLYIEYATDGMIPAK